MITSVPWTCRLVQPSKTIQCVTWQGNSDISLETGRARASTSCHGQKVSDCGLPCTNDQLCQFLDMAGYYCTFRGKTEYSPVLKPLHPPGNLYSVYPCIKWFVLYIERTSMRNQSKFHACNTFLVRVSRGCILWQDTTTAKCHACDKCMLHVALSWSELAGGALHLHQMENKASPVLHPCVGPKRNKYFIW